MPKSTQSASWIADEYGGSYLNNEKQQHRDLVAARDMAVLIQRTVQAKGGDYRRTGELLDETLRELSDRAPFGFVTPAFALGMTQVLLDRANGMSGPAFVQYLEGIRDRDNPLMFWQKSTIDPLFDEVKDRTRAHVEEIYGRSTFSVFGGMKGQHGPLAFGAGAADAVLEEVGGGGRGLIAAAANPVEAGRQAVDMLRNLDRVPQALHQQVREAKQLIDASGLDDYHKGFLTVRVAFIALDAADVIDAGMSIGNLAKRMRNGEVNSIGDAIHALDEGPQLLPQRGQTREHDLSVGDVPARTPAVTASPNARAAALTDQLVETLPAKYREPFREAFTQLLKANNYDTPEEVVAFSRWLNDNPDHAVTRQYHEIAQKFIEQRMIAAYPDRVEFAYQRALEDTFRDAGLTLPQDRVAYMEAFDGPNAAAYRTALDERAMTHVVNNALREIPENVRDAYRRSLSSILGEQGYLGQGQFDPQGAQTYIDRLARAPGDPPAMAVHNRALDIVVTRAAEPFPDGTEAYYARAYRQTFEVESIRNPSAAQRYIDNLNAAPGGPAMHAVQGRAIDAIVADIVEALPRNVRPAYAKAVRATLDEAGLDTPAEALSYARNLGNPSQALTIARLHDRAYDTVITAAVSNIDERSRPAYLRALGEAHEASDDGPKHAADGRSVHNPGSVESLQRYVVDLATSPMAMQKIHDRADELLGLRRPSEPPSAPSEAKTPSRSSDVRPDLHQQVGNDRPAGQSFPEVTVEGPGNRPGDEVEGRNIRVVPEDPLEKYPVPPSTAYTPRFSTQHDLTGEGAGTYTTISGHGVLEDDRKNLPFGSVVQRDSFVVPEGVELYFLGLPGSTISDRLGQAADVGGDLTGVPLLKLGAGDTAPDILILPADGRIKILGTPITVDNPQGVRLSQLIREHHLTGKIVVASCLDQEIKQGQREHWEGIRFDLPERYPAPPSYVPPVKPSNPSPPPSPPTPPYTNFALTIDPNFNTHHGLASSQAGAGYTAIGGISLISGETPRLNIPFQEQHFTVPPGVTLYFPGLPGGVLSNKLAETIEKGQDLSRIALLKFEPGSNAPDPLLFKGDYYVFGDFIRIDKPEGQRLSELIRERGLTGNLVIAGGLSGPGQSHSGVMFFLPEHYPHTGRGGTRSLDLSVEQVLGLPMRTLSTPQEPAREQAPPANDNRQSLLPDTAAPVSGRGDPGLDDPRHRNHIMFASALDRIQTFERGRGIDSGDFARNLAGGLTVSAVESRLPQINHVVFNAEGTRAFAVDTPNLNAEWRRVAYTDVAGAGQQTLVDRKSTRLNSSHSTLSRMPSSA